MPAAALMPPAAPSGLAAVDFIRAEVAGGKLLAVPATVTPAGNAKAAPPTGNTGCCEASSVLTTYRDRLKHSNCAATGSSLTIRHTRARNGVFRKAGETAASSFPGRTAHHSSCWNIRPQCDSMRSRHGAASPGCSRLKSLLPYASTVTGKQRSYRLRFRTLT